MWTSRSKLRNELIESLKRENAALRALLSASGIALPDSPATPLPQRKRVTKKLDESSVYHATRDTRLADQYRREQEQAPTAPASPEPNENSNV